MSRVPEYDGSIYSPTALLIYMNIRFKSYFDLLVAVPFNKNDK
jgi:hypothetical protein